MVKSMKTYCYEYSDIWVFYNNGFLYVVWSVNNNNNNKWYTLRFIIVLSSRRQKRTTSS